MFEILKTFVVKSIFTLNLIIFEILNQTSIIRVHEDHVNGKDDMVKQEFIVSGLCLNCKHLFHSRIFLQDKLGDNSVLLFPTFPSSSYYHFQSIFKSPGFVYCTIFNGLGMPSTNVPVGFDASGMPIGIQVNKY